MRERHLGMKAQLAKMKKRDHDLRIREESVEDKLAEADPPPCPLSFEPHSSSPKEPKHGLTHFQPAGQQEA